MNPYGTDTPSPCSSILVEPGYIHPNPLRRRLSERGGVGRGAEEGAGGDGMGKEQPRR